MKGGRRTGLDAWRLWLVPGMGVKRHVALAVLDTVSHLGGLAGIARLAAHPHPA